MRIAHIGNTAGVGSTLAEEQRNRGHTSDVFVFNKSLHDRFGGTFINYSVRNFDMKGKIFLNLRWRAERKKLFEKLANYEVWHYHYPFGSLKRNVARNLGRRALLNHYHGDDLRGKLDSEFCVVATPDLLEFAPRGIWLPNPLNLDYITGFISEPKNTIPKVAHYPYYEVYGNEILYPDIYSKPLTNLEKKGKCKVVTIIGLSNEGTLREISKCDVVLGKILPGIGWFGRFELEGMALKKPVVSYVSDALYEKYSPPIFRTNQGSVEEDLLALLEDRPQQQRLADAGSEYVRSNHAVEHVCDLTEVCYEKCSAQL